jgi:hypothetical protein
LLVNWSHRKEEFISGSSQHFGSARDLIDALKEAMESAVKIAETEKTTGSSDK